MIRFLNVVAICALVGSAVYAYSIKYDTMLQAEQVNKLKNQIRAERDSIGILKAEWAHLSRPERIQVLADKHLDLQTLPINHIVKAESLPERAAKVDSIGRKLEALGLLEPTNTPRAEAPASPATPSTPKR